MKISLLPQSLFVALVAGASCQSGGHADRCFHDFQDAASSEVAAFCQTFTTSAVTATAGLPTFAAHCHGKGKGKVSSACTRFMKTQTLSSAIASSTTPTPASSSSAPASSSSPPSVSPTCVPTFVLDGASETAFNPANTAFSLRLECGTLDTSNYTVFFSNENTADPWGTVVQATSATKESIALPGFNSGSVTITVAALDTTGIPIMQSFVLLLGSIQMPVQILDETGAPVVGLEVKVDATTHPGISQNQTTDSQGIVTFVNLPPTTIGVFAQTSDNKIGVGGFAASTARRTVQLLPFLPANNTTDLRADNGLTGWTGGTTQDVPVAKRDLALVVSTNGNTGLQKAQSSPKVYPFTKSVFIKYKFQTDEVPGGYFGTQYNDYYVVSIRSNTGASKAISQSMNALGLGSFDSIGATNWFTLTLDTDDQTEWVNFDVGVSNVADNRYQSQVIVSKVGDLTCEECGSCETCPGDPMCQPTCQEPPQRSCAFYTDCAEARLRCGNSGYPVAYGRKNCLAFQSDLSKFTAAGQDFIWGTMYCLQTALRDAINCDSTCSQAGDAAFDSHPGCYINNGFCDLPPQDWWQLVKTVGTDLLSAKALKQVVQTGAACGGHIIGKIDDAITEYLEQAANDVLGSAVHLARAAAMRVLKQYFQDLIDQVNPTPGL
ncbi:hypothetical protein QBC34DRAFT_314123 [Podospora aff. communis PSN243]|uniref:Uncharacterized protein n=1 Tax=Podospora aff. communis PSN243 TaxID=3040156 RepID=A0AAV9FV16_9PEZI|nr:hypothetical protein QBC34DRAFT_314123 [Podospora aff. communis PSN243]